MLEGIAVYNKILLPMWVFKNAMNKEEINENAKKYIEKSFPEKEFVKVEGKFALCTSKIQHRQEVDSMIKNMVITTDEHEIHIKQNKAYGWELIIYRIQHSTKEIMERNNLKTFDSAYMYVSEKYLKDTLNKSVLV